MKGTEQREKNKVEGGTLYLVATPIGNMDDVSERAAKVLAEVDFIAAEDTRRSGLLLSRLGISRPMLSYHDHNRAERGSEIVARLVGGQSCALISDAGTPAISDPGEDLVALCAMSGVRVVSVPGACAAVTALTVSALPTRRFCFEGFLPNPNGERKLRLAAIAKEERTIVLYEAPHRLRRTLEELARACGKERRISLCRELTKLNEEVIRTTLGGALELYSAGEPRGEYVLVLDGCEEAEPETADVCEFVSKLMSSGMSQKDAIRETARQLGLAKNYVYAEVLKNEVESEM